MEILYTEKASLEMLKLALNALQFRLGEMQKANVKSRGVDTALIAFSKAVETADAALACALLAAYEALSASEARNKLAA